MRHFLPGHRIRSPFRCTRFIPFNYLARDNVHLSYAFLDNWSLMHTSLQFLLYWLTNHNPAFRDHVTCHVSVIRGHMTLKMQPRGYWKYLKNTSNRMQWKTKVRFLIFFFFKLKVSVIKTHFNQNILNLNLNFDLWKFSFWLYSSQIIFCKVGLLLFSN